MMLKGRLFLLLLLITSPDLFSQVDTTSVLKQTLAITELLLPITFDGVPNEEAWKNVAPIHLIMFSPVFGKELSEFTEVRIGYNSSYLYVAGNFSYMDASMIRSASLKRDYMGMGGDWFGVILDTFNDKENGLAFFTTPDGLRFDIYILLSALTSNRIQLLMKSYRTFGSAIILKREMISILSLMKDAMQTSLVKCPTCRLTAQELQW